MNRDRFWGIQFDPANVWFLLVATLAGALTATVLGQPPVQVIEMAAAAAAIAVAIGAGQYGQGPYSDGSASG